MHTKIIALLALAFLGANNTQLSTASPLGTAFAYQGRITDGGPPASGTYDLRLSLYDAPTGGNLVAGPVTNAALVVSSGLFTTTVDFGAVFTGTNYWLDLGVRTNGDPGFSPLALRQALTPMPYAMYATTAGTAQSVAATNLVGALTPAQLPSDYATSFSGPLSGDVTGTQGATMVSTVGGVPAASVASGANAANAATSAGTAGAIVARDANGNFNNNSLTLSGNLNLPATSASAGIIYAGGIPFIHAYGRQIFFAGVSAGNLTLSGVDNTAVGAYALSASTTGGYNTASGYGALNSNSTGVANTAGGSQALFSNTTGSQNTANGLSALFANTTGSFNTASGGDALVQNTTGGNNTANGYEALYASKTGSNNVALGYQAGFNITTGSSNLDLGNLGVATDTNIIRIGASQTATYLVGTVYAYGAGLTNLNASQLATGTLPLAQLPAAVVTNGASGLNLAGTLTGTATGFTGPLAGDVTGTQGATMVATVGGSTAANVHSAELAANAATSAGTPGTIVARDANGNFTNNSLTLGGNLNLPATSAGAGIIYAGGIPFIHAYGGQNFFAGAGVGNLTMSGYANANTAVGYNAFFTNTTGSSNTAIGELALVNYTTGGGNTGIGFEALNFNTTGGNNVALGYQAGTAIQTGSFNIDIGNLGVAGDANIIRLGSGQSATYLAGTVYANGVALTSDRNAKENFQPVDNQAVLARVAALPVTQWNYKTDQTGVRHIGPTAQDFQAAFGLDSSDNKHISVVDEGGVALAAIQGLNQKLEAKDAEIQQLQQNVEALRQLVLALAAKK